MDETQVNQEVAERICRGLQWNGRQLRSGECVALLDGQIVATAEDLDGALQALRTAEPDPRRGMVFEVAPPTTDVIR